MIRPEKQLMTKNNAAGIDKRTDAFIPRRRHEASSNRALVIDGMGLVYAAKHSYSKLRYKGQSTSIIFGVPQMIKSLLLKHPTDRLIICWDGDRNAKRIELLPSYKSHRDAKRDPVERAEQDDQVKKLRRLLNSMGIAQAYDKKIEGDDMVYFVVNQVVKTQRVLIASGDKDMCQLINHDISVLNIRTGEIITPFAFKGTYPVELPQFIDYLCMSGDKSDDIPNYSGFGPVTARKFFESFYTVEQYLASTKRFAGFDDKKEVLAHYRRNRKLIDLEYFCGRYYKSGYTPRYWAGQQFPNYNASQFRKYCIRWNLKTMLDPKFVKAFQL